MQPSEIEALPFYELEYTIENLTNDLKNKRDAEEEQNQTGDYNASSYMKQANKMTSNAKSNYGKSINIPKMPKVPNIGKMPRI